MSDMFDGCSGLTSLDLSSFDTSNVTHVGHMFNGCSKLTSLDLSSFDTNNVIDTQYMFNDCSELTTIYVSHSWDITKILFNTTNMFSNCSNLVGGNGTTYNSSYTDKTYARIDTTDTPGYFTDINSPMGLIGLRLSNLVSEATSVTFDYYNDEYNTIIANADTSFVVDNHGRGDIMLYVVGTDVYILSDIEIMAISCYNMFNDLSSLTSIKFNNFNTSNVALMGYMFWGCSELTSLDLSGFDTSNVRDMEDMFAHCSELTTIYVSDTWEAKAGLSMFLNCTKLVGGNGTTYNGDYTNETYARIDAEGTPGYLTNKTAVVDGGTED